MFSGWKSILVQNVINRSKWAKRSQNFKKQFDWPFRPLESKRSFLATFSDEIGHCEVSKLCYPLLLRLKVKLKVKMVSSFRPSIYVHVPSIGHFHHFHFLKTICNHNLEQEQVKPCPEGSEGLPSQSVADFPALFFHIALRELHSYKELSRTIFQSCQWVSQ